jgi:hypothetical protein
MMMMMLEGGIGEVSGRWVGWGVNLRLMLTKLASGTVESASMHLAFF